MGGREAASGPDVLPGIVIGFLIYSIGFCCLFEYIFRYAVRSGTVQSLESINCFQMYLIARLVAFHAVLSEFIQGKCEYRIFNYHSTK